MKRSRLIATVVVGSTIVLGAAAGSIAGIALTAGAQNAAAATGDSSLVEKYQTNESGQTYGEFGVGLTSDLGAHPDLILVVATDGFEGYAYYDAVFGPTPTALEEVAGLASRERQEAVPVYLQDGKTQIGEYLAY